MEKIYETNQLHFFSQNSDISPGSDGDNIKRVIEEALPGNKFAPIVANEINVGLMGGPPRRFLTLVDNAARLRIEFPSNEIIVFMDQQNTDQFQGTVQKILSSLKPLLGLKKANRLSVLNSQFFSGSEEKYQRLYQSIFTYRNVTPFEWDNRIVTRDKIEGTDEDINSISIIRRVQARIGSELPKDVIAFETDSNTVAQNDTYRFTIEESEKIYNGLFENNNKLIEQLKRYQ